MLKIGVICVKDHEFVAMSEQLKLSNIGLSRENYATQNQRWGFKTQTWDITTANHHRIELVLITFGKIQGPTVASSRTVQSVMELGLHAVGMVGICGGRRLGTVFLACEAFMPEGGHVENEETIGMICYVSIYVFLYFFLIL